MWSHNETHVRHKPATIPLWPVRKIHPTSKQVGPKCLENEGCNVPPKFRMVKKPINDLGCEMPQTKWLSSHRNAVTTRRRTAI